MVDTQGGAQQNVLEACFVVSHSRAGSHSGQKAVTTLYFLSFLPLFFPSFLSLLSLLSLPPFSPSFFSLLFLLLSSSSHTVEDVPVQEYTIPLSTAEVVENGKPLFVSHRSRFDLCLLVLFQYIDIAIYRFINTCDTTSIPNCAYRYIVIQGQRSIISRAYLMS